MRKTRLQVDALQVETFVPAEVAMPRLRGTVRGAEKGNETLVRACVTQQFDCTAQGGYTCDYGYCASNDPACEP